MKLGIDCDGVLCNFSKRYAEYAKKFCGLDVDISQQREWSFESIGVPPEMDDRIWEEIKNTENFWRRLEPLSGAWTLFWSQRNHELFFITSRVPTKGMSVVAQTAGWLQYYHNIEFPTVLVADQPSKKIPLALNLGIDAFVDDKPSTVKSMRNAGILAYILDQPYNQDVEDPRVKSVDEFLSQVLSDANSRRSLDDVKLGVDVSTQLPLQLDRSGAHTGINSLADGHF